MRVPRRLEQHIGRGMRLNLRGISIAILMLVSWPSTGAMAQVITPFRSESQAQRHCPGEAVVWLDLKSERYYLKGQRRYAAGPTGSFVCMQEARDSGYRRSRLGLR